MKLLAIGDFHGKFPKKLEKRIKKEKPDLIISIGDYFPFSLRKTFFKYCYGKPIEIWEVVGRSRFKKSFLKDLKVGERIIKKLNSVNIPVITTIGNLDYLGYLDSQDSRVKNAKKKDWKWADQDFFRNIIKKYKNIKRVDYNFIKFKDIIFIGAFGHSNPGYVKSKTYRRYRAKLEKLFKKFRKENKNKKVIFIFHNMPYNCELDIIKDKEADERVGGEHYGSKLIRRIINKYQPVLGIGGHMHENQGKCKIGKTLVVNTGAACEGKAALIELDNNKGKVKRVRFIR